MGSGIDSDEGSEDLDKDSSNDFGNDTAEIAGEFPGWEAWQGIDRTWHARIRGATPPVMVHGADLVVLRDQIVRYLRRAEAL